MEGRRLNVYALALLMRPLARFCLRRSLALQEVIDVWKRVFVEEAQAELSRAGAKVTVSRLSVMTGVHRREVIRICDHPRETHPGMAISFRVVNFWRTSPEFRSISGRPKTLTVDGLRGEFSALVRKVNKELNPYTVLFELERSGIVERTKLGVKLRSDIFAPQASEKPALEMLAQDQEDLFEAVLGNLSRESRQPNLHVTTSYDNIPESALPKIRKWLLDRGAQWHMEIRQYLGKFDRDSPGGGHDSRDPAWTVTIGTFGVVKATGGNTEVRRK